MPQDVKELGRKVKAKYPKVYDDLSDEDLGRKVKTKFPGAYDDFTDTPAAPPEESFLSNLGTGLKQGLTKLVKSGVSLSEILGSAAAGDFRPLMEAAELTGRGAVSSAGFLTAGAPADPQIAPLEAQVAARRSTDPNFQAIAAAERELAAQAARNPSLRNKIARGIGAMGIESIPYIASGIAGGGVPAMAGVAGMMSAGDPANAALNVGTAVALPAVAAGAGKFVAPILQRIRGGRAAAAEVEAAIAPAAREVPPASGETTPTVQRAMAQFEAEVQRINASNLTPRQKAIELEIAIQRIGQEASGQPPGPGIGAVSLGARRGYPEPIQQFPENPNAIQQAGALPGEGGPPPLEADLSPQTFGVKAAPELAYSETTGPSLSETQALSVGGGTGAAVKEPLTFGRAAATAFRTPAQIFRTFRTAFDLSAPGNQGAVLGRAHPILAFRAFVKQLKAIKPSNRAAIDDAILNDPYTQLGRDFDLHIATGGAPEEAFMVRAVNKIPGIKASEATYRTYLDTLRLSVWTNYVKALESWGYTTANNPEAYRQVARFINIATGRGSLKPGGALDKAMALGGDVLFAPRNLASKFQLLNPDTYLRLAPGARRLVLKDAATSFGAILGAGVALRAAGVKVGLNPTDDDFLTARIGNHRYDLTGGLKSEVRFLARMVAGSYNQFNGEGNLPSEKPLNVATTYARGKLSPAVGIAYDALKGSDIKGEKFSDKSAADIAFQFGPMIAEDLREGYKDSGLQGLAISAPAFVGARISAYPDRAKAAFLDTPAAFRNEQKKSAEPRIYLEPRRAKDETEQDETPQDFARRLTKANSLIQEYAPKLLDSNAYRSATPRQQKAAREHLERVIKVQSHRQRANRGSLSPPAILSSVKASEKREAAKKKRGY